MKQNTTTNDIIYKDITFNSILSVVLYIFAHFLNKENMTINPKIPLSINVLTYCTSTAAVQEEMPYG
jgi:hypothetical protein